MAQKKCCGPGYPTPRAAMEGPREELLYTVVTRGLEASGHDWVGTVDVDPKSPTYSQIIHRLDLLHAGDEVHHTGWNACSSCYTDPSAKRSRLVIPCLHSSRVYAVDTETDPRAPTIGNVVEPEDLYAVGHSSPHTTHCLASGDVMLSVMGDPEGNNKGGFVLVDGTTFKVKGTWGKPTEFGYDFWYQPRINRMLSTEWGAPNTWRKGFDATDYPNGKYGRSLHVWDWKTSEHLQTLDLGDDGAVPLEIRFCHDPDRKEGVVGCALNSCVFRFWLDEESDKMKFEKVVDIPNKKVENWLQDEMSALIADVLLSLDDRYMYITNWVHGDIRQYDITDLSKPKLVGQVFVGGCAPKGSPVKVTHDEELKEQPEPLFVKGVRIPGGPKMMQLSLDGKRLYVTSSIYSAWDKQFYPDMYKNGGVMLQIDVDSEKGGLTVNPDFLVHFGEDEGGPNLPHEMRYPGGDCTSEIWI